MEAVLKLNNSEMAKIENMLSNLKMKFGFQNIKDEHSAFSCSFGGCSGSCDGCTGCTSCSSCSGGCSGGFTYG